MTHTPLFLIVEFHIQMREGEDLDRTRSYKYNKVVPEPHNSDDSLISSKLVHDQDAPMCRICMDTETTTNILLHPCRCKGTMKHIHEECLKAWILSQNSDLDRPQCELCKTSLLMEFTIVTQCSPRKSCKEGLNQCSVITLLISVMCMLFLITFLLGDSYVRTSETNQELGYTITLMVTCLLSGLVVLILVINSIKEVCCTVTLEKWRIHNQEFPEENRQKSNGEGRFLPSVLVIPKSLRLRGRKIRTPAINPSLPGVMQKGRTVAYTPISAYSSVEHNRTPNVNHTDPNRFHRSELSSYISLTSK